MTLRADEAADWVRGALAQGSDLCMFLSQRLQEFPEAIVVGKESAASRGFEHGQGIETTDADAAIEQIFGSMARSGAKTLLIEDDLARRGDVGLPSDVAFVGERVLRWVDLTSEPAPVSRLLRTGSSGYPLNAFVCDRQLSDLPLTAGHLLSESETLVVADSTCAVITTVYDAESFLVLMAADLRSVPS